MALTLFERCGGFATVRKIVSAFYDKVLDSPALQKHFADVDMRALIDHQAKFVAMVMGGPASFTDDQLRRVHAPLGITSAEFAEMVSVLQETLEDFDLPAADIAHVVREISRRQSLIVTRPDQA
jgi:hemoglobin